MDRAEALAARGRADASSLSVNEARSGSAAGSAGSRIRHLRQAHGLSRADLAERLGVDVTAVAAWEADKYRPREGKRVKLAAMFEVTLADLFPADNGSMPLYGASVCVIDGLERMDGRLTDRAAQCARSIRALHCSRLKATSSAAYSRFREQLSQRLLAGSLAFDGIEVVYDLTRLREVACNILRYTGAAYRVAVYCGSRRRPLPGLDFLLFDNREVVLGAWEARAGISQDTNLALSHEAFASYFRQAWFEARTGAIALNAGGAGDLSNLRACALKLGLAEADWSAFQEEASLMANAVGMPPLP